MGVVVPGNIFSELGRVWRVELDSKGKMPWRVWGKITMRDGKLAIMSVSGKLDEIINTNLRD